MAKEYKISRGENFGNTNGSLMGAQINTQDYVYGGSISNVFNDPKVKRDMMYAFFGGTAEERDVGHHSFTSNCKEWHEFLSDPKNNDEDGDLIVSQEDRDHKLFELWLKTYGKDAMNYVNNVKGQINQEYAPMFERIETMYNNSIVEQVVPQRLQANNGIADFGDRPLLLHNIPLVDREGLEARKDLGIIASEWFGKMESYGECRFCASFTKQRGMNFENSETIIEAGDKNAMFFDDSNPPSPTLTYIIDPQTPAVQELVKMDLWKYCRNKESGDLDGYTIDEQKYLSQLLEWSSAKKQGMLPNELIAVSGKAERIAKDKPTWVAIPGGVPSKNIIALQVKGIENNPEMQRLAQEASEMYGVPLIDMAGRVIAGEQFLVQEQNSTIEQ